MASQLLGNVGTEGHGLSGLEYKFDRQLRGQDGERRLVRDALGDTIELREVKRTVPGEQLRLTLDANIQDHTEEVLDKVGEEWQPKGATALVMDPNDGVDPGARQLAAGQRQPALRGAGLRDDEPRDRRHLRAGLDVQGVHRRRRARGRQGHARTRRSTSRRSSRSPTARSPTRTRAGGRRCSVAGILKVSSNVGAALIGRTLGARRFDQWVRKFGFGKPTGVDLPGEEAGILLDYADYSGSTAGNMAMGQGLAVTPMQMAAGYSAIANGGILRAPHIVDSVGGQKQPVPAGHRVISEKTASQVRTMLEGVLGPGGTATGAAIDGYELGGKTGTAEKPDENGGYSKDKFVASFVGFAPARKPRLLVAVMVDEPKGDIYGGTVAGPAFKDITSFALTNLRIGPG